MYYNKYIKYKNKYLKYKSKYLKLKGGVCDKCPKKGFVQHHGECWHDAFSMAILFSDDLSEDIQYSFNNWMLDESQINNYFEIIDLSKRNFRFYNSR